MIKNMANYRKARLMNTQLKMLNIQERDYIEKLAKSLLAVQNTSNAEAEEANTEARGFSGRNSAHGESKGKSDK